MFSIQCKKDSDYQQKCSNTPNVCFPEVLAYIYALKISTSQVHSIWHQNFSNRMCNDRNKVPTLRFICISPQVTVHLPCNAAQTTPNSALWYAPEHFCRAGCPALSGSRRDWMQPLGSICQCRECLRLDGYTKWSTQTKWWAHKIRCCHNKHQLCRNIYQCTCCYADVTAALWIPALCFFHMASYWSVFYEFEKEYQSPKGNPHEELHWHSYIILLFHNTLHITKFLHTTFKFFRLNSSKGKNLLKGINTPSVPLKA